MKLKANRSFHTSGLGMIHHGTEVDVHDALAKELIDKGLATQVGETPGTKAEPGLENKAEPLPENKARKRKARIEEDSAETGEA
jgi:hypothetical protein